MLFLNFKINIFFLIVFSLLIIIFIVSMIECNHYKINVFDIKNLKNSDKLKLIFISDFHNKLYKNNNEKLILDIININPDYIIFGGDIIDFSALQNLRSAVKCDVAFKFLKDLSDRIKNNKTNIKKIYFGFGNHELRLKERNDNATLTNTYNELLYTLKKCDIEIIDNKTLNLSDGINLSGLNLYKGYYGNVFSKRKKEEHIRKEVLDKYFEDIDKDKFNIMAFHKPDYAEDFINYGYDLVLSGHNHGGLINFPFIGPVISPDMKLFPKYRLGLYTYNGKNIIVTAGLGEHFLKIRVNNLPEICVININ